jgi:acyl-CoA thioesterase-1
MLVPVKLLAAIPLLALLCSCSSGTKPETQEAHSTPAVVPATSPATPAVQDTRKVLVVFGDSLAAGNGLAPGQSFPDDMQNKLAAQGYAWRVVNLGIGGDTTEDAVPRIDSAVSLHPAIVILELGGNDGLRGLPLTGIRQNLDAMIRAFQSAGARVVLAGMTLPPNYGPNYIQGFQKIFQGLATQYHLTFIPFLLSDIVTPDSGTQNLRYFQPDGIHPTAAGAMIVSETVLRTVKPLLGAPSPSTRP